MISYGSAALVIMSFCMGLLATLLCRPLAKWTRMMNFPNPIVPQHIKPTPYLGGLAVAMGAVAGLFMMDALANISEIRSATPMLLSKPTALLAAGGAGFLILGLLDDAVGLTPFVKLGIQFVLTIIILGLGWVLDGETGSLWLLALNAIWIVGIVNAVNFTDVCDGLVAGLCCIALGIIALKGDTHTTLALALAGATVGFMIFNFPPASIFLGDAGSHFLGFTLAAMTMPTDILVSDRPFFGLLLLAVFIFELIFITRMRVKKGLKWWRGSPDHFSLRMQAAGFSKTKTIVIAWTSAALFGAAALVTTTALSVLLILCLMIGVVVLSYTVWRWLECHEVPTANQKQEAST